MLGYRYSALVVDDEVAVRRLTVRALERRGFDCTEAASGAEAGHLLATRRFQAIVTDLRMPNGNGYSLAVDQLEQRDRPLIVILTGVMEPRLAEDLLRRGIDDIMFKPVDYEMFAGKVAGLMERRQDHNAVPETSAIPNDSLEMNGLATALEAKTMIDAQAVVPADAATAVAVDLAPRLSRVPDAQDTVPPEVGLLRNEDRRHEPPTNSCDPARPLDRNGDAAGAPRRPAGGTGIVSRWAALVLRNLTGRELAWLIVVSLLAFSLWLWLQVHMLRQTNRAIEALEQLGARIAISEKRGASVWFEPDERPSGLDSLQDVPDLRHVDLAQTRAIDDDLRALSMLADLEELDLQRTLVTDAGLAHLKDLHKLRKLSLRGTQVTDAGLEHLRRLRALRAVSLRDTGVTAIGARKLQQALPFTRIEHSSLPPREANQSDAGS